jgi:hypothetical protein
MVQMKEIETAAQALCVQLRFVKVLGPNDLENAFSAMTKGRASGISGLASALFFAHRGRTADLAAKIRLSSD